MSLLLNVLWIILGGLFIALYYVVVGLLFCITVVGIPFGVQCFKMAGLALCPFGKDIQPGPGNTGCLSIFFNIVWILLAGWEIAVAHFVLGLFFCITIIGIPFGKQHFKLALLAFLPFGNRIG